MFDLVLRNARYKPGDDVCYRARFLGDGLKKAGARIINLERACKALRVLDRSDGTLPRRFLNELYGPSGSELVVVELNEFLEEY